MARLVVLQSVAFALLALLAPEALAQAGGGSSGFSGGGGSSGGGGFSGGGGSGGGGSSGGGGVWIVIIFVAVIFVFVVPAATVRRRRRARAARDARVSTASAEAAEDDPAFAAPAVKSDAAALYVAIQQAWSERDDAALERMLGPDLLVEWRRRLADFAAKGWVNEVTVRRGPEVEYVGLVNREGSAEDHVTVTVSAKLHSVVRTSAGATITRDNDKNSDGEIEICEYWTLGRDGDRWRLQSIEQEAEGAHHLDAPIVASPWSDDARLADESLVELATADAPPPGVAISELISVEFDGTAREAALDLALADPRCAPDVLEAAARRAVASWAQAVDGDDVALLLVATPAAAAALLYPGGDAGGRARIVVRGPVLLRLAITALHADREPPRMEVQASLRGRRYVEDRDTAAVLSGSKDREIEFAEHWTFSLEGMQSAPWLLVDGGGA